MSTRLITRGARAATATVAAVVAAGLSWLPGPAYADASVNLWAVTGTATMPGGASVTVWGYQDSNAAADRPGGPTLSATVGEQVTITLHNQVGAPTGLLVQGQSMVPDLDGIGNGATRTYTFTADRPGTFLYEAAPLPGAQYQPAMGLYGALVVQPASGRAYGDASTAFDTDQVLLLGEIDPTLSNSANPAEFDMRGFHPKYFTINGLAYPDTAPVVADPDSTQLLRYVNAGMSHRSMTVLGARQTIIARDGAPLTHADHFVADTMGPGQTMDALVDVPASRSVDTELFVYDASNSLHNTNTAGVGGMLTSIPVVGAAAGDTVGPMVSASFLDGTLSAHYDDTGDHGGSAVDAVEYYLDDAVADSVSGSGSAMTPVGDTSGDATAVVTLPDGAPFDHTLYVRAHDAAGNWGPMTSVLVSANDTGGPSVVSPVLTPHLANGANTKPVKVSATADDTSVGNSAINAGEYVIGDPGGTPVEMTVSPAGASIASIDGTIPVAALDALSEGDHPVFIRAQDAELNWGDYVTVQLTVDETGPQTSGVSVEPTPNNGFQSFSSSVPAVRVMVAQMTDPISGGVNSQIAAGEAFIDDTAQPDGSGIRLTASNGVFRDTTDSGYADIPLATVQQMTEGTHTIYVHAKDAAGNWGPVAETELVVDRTGPTVQALSASVAGAVARTQSAVAGPTSGATDVTVTGTASDVSGVTAAQWWWDKARRRTSMTVTDAGGGAYDLTATVPVTGLGDGSHRLRVRVRDQAGNWTRVATRVQVTWPLLFSTLGNAAPRGVAGTGVNSDGYQWSGSAFTRTLDLTDDPYGVPAGANVDGLSRVDATHFYLSFSNNTRLPGPGKVQDEDVVYWDDGRWSLFFDGTAHGLRSPKADIDALSVVGDTLFFSTQGNTSPRGVRGRADDSDIYRWNGTRFSRVWDASTHGVPGGANLDGYDRVDAEHFYLSFTATHRIPGLGKVQDEDVVSWGNASRMVYFDGTAHGMAGPSHDVDGLDVP